MASNPACRSFMSLLSPFIDGELPVADRQTVERHLAACKDCTARVADLRAESGLVRLGMEMMADEADFSGFAQKVMARVTPERPPLLDRLRVSLSEMFLYQRGAMMTAVAACAVAVLGVVVVSQIQGAPEGYAGDRVSVQTVSVGDNAVVKPVVTTTDTGNTILWLVDQPAQPQGIGQGPDQPKTDGEKKKLQKDQDEEQEEEIGVPHTPKGGDL